LHGQETPLHFQLDFRKCLRYNLFVFVIKLFKVKESSYGWTVFGNRFFGIPLFVGRLEELACGLGARRVGDRVSVPPFGRIDYNRLFIS
jgi:hypothetical protein